MAPRFPKQNRPSAVYPYTFDVNLNQGWANVLRRRATFFKNLAAEDRTLSLQSRNIYSVCK